MGRLSARNCQTPQSGALPSEVKLKHHQGGASYPINRQRAGFTRRLLLFDKVSRACIDIINVQVILFSACGSGGWLNRGVSQTKQNGASLDKDGNVANTAKLCWAFQDGMRGLLVISIRVSAELSRKIKVI